MTEGYKFLQCLFKKYSDTEYINEARIPIMDFTKQVFLNSIEVFKPSSYQTVYCQVYKSVCKGYQEQLFGDLMNFVTEHCQSLKLELDESMKKTTNEDSNAQRNAAIEQFINFLQQYHRSNEAIVSLFHYLDVVYVKAKMKSTIEQELLIIYKTIIVESHISHIFAILQQLIHTSDCPSKERISLLLQMLKDILPESAMKQHDLLKRFCCGEDILSDLSPNDDSMITSASRSSSKRSVDELPGEEDQPSAKRTTNTIKSFHPET